MSRRLALIALLLAATPARHARADHPILTDVPPVPLVPPRPLANTAADQALVKVLQDLHWVEHNFVCGNDTRCVPTDDEKAIATLDLQPRALKASLPAALFKAVAIKDLALSEVVGTTLPGELSALVALERLSLRHSPKLLGSLPAAWKALERLHTLDLAQTGLKGRLDPLSLPANVEILDLGQTDLTGGLPAGLSTLTALRELAVNDCTSLGGTLPAQLADASTLVRLDASGAGLTGALDGVLAFDRLPRLRELSLKTNGLSKGLPTALGHCRELERLHLESNRFTGRLPQQWWRLTELTQLTLASNALDGPLPPQWRQFRVLERLSLDSNKLTGPLPAVWADEGMLALRSFTASGNRLTGSLPGNWVNMAELIELDVSRNAFDATFPAAFPPTLMRLKLGGGSNKWCPVPPQLPPQLSDLVNRAELNDCDGVDHSCLSVGWKCARGRRLILLPSKSRRRGRRRLAQATSLDNISPTCPRAVCNEERCCEPYCGQDDLDAYACPLNMTRPAGAHDKPCGAGGCSDDDCCIDIWTAVKEPTKDTGADVDCKYSVVPGACVGGVVQLKIVVDRKAQGAGLPCPANVDVLQGPPCPIMHDGAGAAGRRKPGAGPAGRLVLPSCPSEGAYLPRSWAAGPP